MKTHKKTNFVFVKLYFREQLFRQNEDAIGFKII